MKLVEEDTVRYSELTLIKLCGLCWQQYSPSCATMFSVTSTQLVSSMVTVRRGRSTGSIAGDTSSRRFITMEPMSLTCR